ncbi:MAG: NAD(P)H-hydrate dehydratase [Candidatus Latescibacterota bacterium]
MEVLTSEQMRLVDEETIKLVCPGLELMERAGKAVADQIHFLVGDSYGTPFKAVIFAGAGNNGGDALVVARHLSELGCKVSVHLLKSPDDLTMDALKNYWRLSHIIKTREEVQQLDASRPDWPEAARRDLVGAQVIVDGIFGTGISGAPRGKALDMIKLINKSGIPVVSIDIPSGVQGDTGALPGEAVCAGYTVSIGRPKLGLLFYPGKSYVGEMSVADIGFPNDIVSKHARGMWMLDWPDAAARIPKRAPDVHKYSCGTLLVVAGSRAYTGAALLTARAALRGGCGMVYLALPEGVRDRIDTAAWEVITIPLPETTEGTISPAGLATLEPYIDKADALAVGPGMGRNEDTDRFVRELLAKTDKPVVLDADGIIAFAGACEELGRRSAPLVITPHSGELKALFGSDIPADPLARIEKTRHIAQSMGGVLLHKGAPTLIASPEGDIWINAGGSSALATAGSGDVLTGFVGSFLAQGANATDAALVSAFLHGKAGEYAAMEMGVRGVIAGDLLWEFNRALVELEDLLPDGSPYRPNFEEYY